MTVAERSRFHMRSLPRLQPQKNSEGRSSSEGLLSSAQNEESSTRSKLLNVSTEINSALPFRLVRTTRRVPSYAFLYTGVHEDK